MDSSPVVALLPVAKGFPKWKRGCNTYKYIAIHRGNGKYISWAEKEMHSIYRPALKPRGKGERKELFL